MKMKFNPWPYGIALFFVLLFCFIATVIVIASTHRDTLVSANYYEQELKYQNRIDAAARAEKSGANIRVDAAAGKMLVTVPSEQLKENLGGKVTFYRASAPELDREFDFVPGADGTQSFDAARFASGLWTVCVSWKAGGQDYLIERKVTL